MRKTGTKRIEVINTNVRSTYVKFMPTCNFNMYILLVVKPVIIYNDLLFICQAKSLKEVIINVSCERMNEISETEIFRIRVRQKVLAK